MSTLLQRDFIWFCSCRALSAVAFYPLNITIAFSKFCSVCFCLPFTHTINTAAGTARFRSLFATQRGFEVLSTSNTPGLLDSKSYTALWELGIGIPSPTGILHSRKKLPIWFLMIYFRLIQETFLHSHPLLSETGNTQFSQILSTISTPALCKPM